MGKSTNYKWSIFNSYVSLPEGISKVRDLWRGFWSNSLWPHPRHPPEAMTSALETRARPSAATMGNPTTRPRGLRFFSALGVKVLENSWNHRALGIFFFFATIFWLIPIWCLDSCDVFFFLIGMVNEGIQTKKEVGMGWNNPTSSGWKLNGSSFFLGEETRGNSLVVSRESSSTQGDICI